jgi:hypothetical protein
MGVSMPLLGGMARQGRQAGSSLAEKEHDMLMAVRSSLLKHFPNAEALHSPWRLAVAIPAQIRCVASHLPHRLTSKFHSLLKHPNELRFWLHH